MKLCGQLLPSFAEQAAWKPPPHIHPHPKDFRPFFIWSIDLLPKLIPPGPNGEQVVVVAVDVFSKWVEAAPLVNKGSATVARWIHESLTCRYGTPARLRCDLGMEFQGAVADYCATMGI